MIRSIVGRGILSLTMVAGCADDSPFSGACASDTDCESGERCNVNERLCQDIFSSGAEGPCSTDEHCADELVCNGGTCGVDAYAPCTPGTQTCGGSWSCGFSLSGETSACTLACDNHEQCRGVDSFYQMAGVDETTALCLNFDLQEPASFCAFRCSTNETCGGDAASYEYRGAPYSPRCDESLGVCTWTPRL